MGEISLVHWFQELPQRVAGGDAPAVTGVPAAGDGREPSPDGRSLLVETRVRQAVVGELRRLAQRRTPPPEQG